MLHSDQPCSEEDDAFDHVAMMQRLKDQEIPAYSQTAMGAAIHNAVLRKFGPDALKAREVSVVVLPDEPRRD